MDLDNWLVSGKVGVRLGVFNGLISVVCVSMIVCRLRVLEVLRGEVWWNRGSGF